MGMGGQPHSGGQQYQQPQYTQPLPAGQQFPEPESPWGPPQPNNPFGTPQHGAPPPQASQPQFGAGPQFGPGQFPPPGGPRKRKTGLIVAAVLGVLLLIAGGVTVVVLNKDDSSGPGGETPSLVEAGGTGAETTSRSTTRRTTTTRPAVPTPVVPGYRVVAAEGSKLVYDVPSSWKEYSEQESQKEAAAGDGHNYCLGSVFRSIAFLTVTGGSDTNAAVSVIGKETAKSDFNNDKPEGGAPSPFESSNGKVKGSFAEFTGPWKPDKPGCTTDRFSVYVFAFPLDGGKSGALVIDADRNTAGELDIEGARKILASLRSIS